MNRFVTFLLSFLSTCIVQSQELFNFYLEPHSNQDKIILHTIVYRKPLTYFAGIQTSSSGNVLDVSLCYQNSSGIGTTWDDQTFIIDLPSGFSSFEMNINLYGDDDGAPCELTSLVDSGEINFDIPYNPTDFTTIPDNYFELYLENTLSGDGSINGLVPTHKIENVSSVFLDDTFFIIDPIYTIEGIEDFTRLRVLNFTDNSISQVDLGNNLNLQSLYCSFNNLSELDVRFNTDLRLLYTGWNNLTELDISENILLERLSFAEEGLTSIDLNNNSNLKFLSFNGANLVNIDVSTNLLLEELGIGTTTFTELDVSNNTLLRNLSLTNTLITNLDLTNNLLLEDIECQHGVLEHIAITGLTNLKDLYIIDNNLHELDASSNTSLENLSVLFNDLHMLNIQNGNNENMTTMYAQGNPNLFCIQVDDEDQAPYVNWGADPQVIYSEDCSLGNIHFHNMEVVVSPNPFRDTITLHSKTIIDQVSLFNLFGQQLGTWRSGFDHLVLGDLASGVYILKIVSEGKIETVTLAKN